MEQSYDYVTLCLVYRGRVKVSIDEEGYGCDKRVEVLE